MRGVAVIGAGVAWPLLHCRSSRVSSSRVWLVCAAGWMLQQRRCVLRKSRSLGLAPCARPVCLPILLFGRPAVFVLCCVSFVRRRLSRREMEGAREGGSGV